MYYLMMKTALKPDFKSKTFFSSKSFTLLREKKISFVDFKFYQRLFVVLISLSTILIFPESPRQLENICELNYSRKSCTVW
tara:strand:- start:4448 stop:4690 length:243 start_codon:yes stop_codon:yes gene_type:complete